MKHIPYRPGGSSSSVLNAQHPFQESMGSHRDVYLLEATHLLHTLWITTSTSPLTSDFRSQREHSLFKVVLPAKNIS